MLRLAIVLLCLSGFAWSADTRLENERVMSVNSKITIRKDGSLLVQEVFQVNVLGISLQNGIIRELPTQAQRSAPKLTVREVKMDDRPIGFHVDRAGGTVRIVIGEPDQPLVTGPHVFRLLYETAPVVTQSKGRDQLAWDVTGWNWDIPIDSITAVVELPKGLLPEELVLQGTTGGEGPRSKRYSFDFDTPGAVTFTAAGLQPHEGLAVTIDFPQGYVRHRSWGMPLVVLEHAGTFVALLGLFATLLYWGVLWFNCGRSPKLVRQAARTSPPNAVSAAASRFLRRRSADGKTFTTVLISLARKGILRIEETEESFTVGRTSADLHSVSPEEREFAKALFGDEVAITLKMNPLRLKTALNTLKKSLATSYLKAFTPVWAFAWPALMIGAVALLISLYLEVRPFVNEQFLPGLILMVVFGVCVVLLRQVWPAAPNSWKQEAGEADLAGTSGPNRPQLLTAVLLSTMLLGVLALIAVKVALLWAILLAAQTAVNVWFTGMMQVPTARGQRLLDEVEGFRFYLRKHCSELTIRSENEEQRQKTFEQYLDFAFALDLEAEWARRIGECSERPYRPDWYNGDHFLSFYLRRAQPGASSMSELAQSIGTTGVR